MPVSKKRKRKNGKSVSYRQFGRDRRELDSTGDLTAGVTLQDLINMVAYQEYVESGVIANVAIPDTATVTYADDLPVTVGEGDEKRRVGTATPIEGQPGHVSIQFDDPDTAAIIRAVDSSDYSIGKENE